MQKILDLNIGEQNLPIKDNMFEFLDFMMMFPHIAVDTERDPKTKRALGISVAYLKLGMYFPVGHLEDANIDDDIHAKLMSVIETHPLRVFQNASHDLFEFDRPLQGRFADTMVMAHMIDENVVSKSLDYLHKLYCGGEGKRMHPLMKDIIKNFGWQYVPVRLMYDYAKQDAVATSELFEVLEPLYIEQFGPLFSED